MKIISFQRLSIKKMSHFFGLKKWVALSLVAAMVILISSTAETSEYSANAGKLLWKYSYKGASETYLGAPAVYQDLVIVPHGNDDIFAFDLYTGREVWKKSENRPGKNLDRPAAGIWKGRIFIPDMNYNKGVMNCLDVRTGNILWQYNTPVGKNPNVDYNRRQIGNTPVVKNGRLYFTDYQGVIYCLNPIDGSLIWSTDINAVLNVKVNSSWDEALQRMFHVRPDALEFENPFYLGEKNLFATSNGGHLLSVNLETGRKNWVKKFKVWHRTDVYLAGIIGKKLFCVYGPLKAGRSLYSHNMIAYDTKTGRKLWKSPRLAGSNISGLQQYKGNIAFMNSNVLFGTDSQTNYFTRVNIRTGKRISRKRLRYHITPAQIIDGRRYYIRNVFYLVKGRGGSTFSIELRCDDDRTGRNLWKYTLINKSNDWYADGTQPNLQHWKLTIHEGRAFAVVKEKVYCIDIGKAGKARKAENTKVDIPRGRGAAFYKEIEKGTQK